MAFKIGDRVRTELGDGTIVNHENVSARCPREGIKLDKNPFNWKKNCYYFFLDEIKPL